MSLARQLILRYGVSTRRPSASAGTRKLESPAAPPPGSLAAVTTWTAVIGVPAFVMNAFAPSIRHLSPTSAAVVAASAASVPPPGSVSANDAIASPAASAGSQRSFCASDPNREIMAPPSPTAADSVIATD